MPETPRPATALDVNDLIGIPFADGGRSASGVDCWGLVMLVYGRLGVTLPDYRISAFASEQIGRTIDRDKAQWRSVDAPEPGDVILMSLDAALPGVLTHCAVFIGGDRAVHALDRVGVHVFRIDGPLWRNKIEGFYRWTGPYR